MSTEDGEAAVRPKKPVCPCPSNKKGTTCGFMVLHWMVGGFNIASNFAMLQQKVTKKTTDSCLYRYMEKIHFSEYSNVCFASVLWTGKCIQHICWTSRMHSVYIDEKH